MTDISRDDALEHFGVRGMKWGVRRGDSSGGQSSSPKMSRGEKRQARRVADQEKASNLVKEAMKDPEVLIRMGNTVVSGREFTNHLMAGGYLNVRMTDVYARKGPTGQYVLEPRRKN